MAERTIITRLRAEIADFKSKMSEAAKSSEDASSRIGGAITKNSTHINTLSNQAGLLGAAMVAAAGVAVMAFANFDESMSAVEAATHASAETMDDLRDAALDAGARTKFSATEAAGAIEELAKAGVSAADILGGGLDGALDLAAAGNLDVAEAAGIAAVALKQFNLEGEDVTHVADLLAAGAGKAMGDVTDLGSALRQAGQVANSTGLSIEETTAGLAAFASAGLLGSDAGTSFKAMLQRLTPQSAEAQAKMDELGISAYDAQGQFIGLAEFSGNLQSALKDLTPEQRNAALATIFGSDAVRAANVLYSEGEQGIRDWTTAVDDSGYAAETAAIRMDNLKGDWEEFTGAAETALIGLGEAGNGPLRGLVQTATDIVNAFSDLPDMVQGGLLAIVGSGGLVLLGMAGIGKLIVGINDTRNALKAMGVSAKVAGTAVGVASAGLAIAAVGVTMWATAQAEARAKVDALADSLDQQTGALSANSDAWIQAELTTDTSFGVGNSQSMIEAADQMGISVETLAAAYRGNADAAAEAKAASQEWADSQGWDPLLKYDAQAGAFNRKIDEQADRLTEAKGIVEDKGRVDEAGAESQGELAAAYDTTTESVAAQIPTLEDLIALQSEAAGVVMSERDAQRALQSAIDEATVALDTNGATLDITTEKGRANQSALDDIAKSGWDLIESMEANGATQDELQYTMGVSRQAFLDAAAAMGMSAEDASRLADEMGLIPAKVNVPVSVDTSAAERKVATLKALFASLTTEGVRVGVDVQRSGYYANRAEGGIVYGPGTSTSDSIPARLSNGEYVIKADSVSRYGKGFFDNLNAQRFASGGYVGAAQMAPAASSRMPDVSVVVERMETGTPQDVGREVGWALVGRSM